MKREFYDIKYSGFLCRIYKGMPPEDGSWYTVYCKKRKTYFNIRFCNNRFEWIKGIRAINLDDYEIIGYMPILYKKQIFAEFERIVENED